MKKFSRRQPWLPLPITLPPPLPFPVSLPTSHSHSHSHSHSQPPAVKRGQRPSMETRGLDNDIIVWAAVSFFSFVSVIYKLTNMLLLPFQLPQCWRTRDGLTQTMCMHSPSPMSPLSPPLLPCPPSPYTTWTHLDSLGLHLDFNKFCKFTWTLLGLLGLYTDFLIFTS